MPRPRRGFPPSRLRRSALHAGCDPAVGDLRRPGAGHRPRRRTGHRHPDLLGALGLPRAVELPRRGERILGNVAADSGRPSNVFSVATQYTDASGSNNIRYHVASNTAILDNANPTLPGCVPDAGPVYADNSGYTSCIDDAQVEGEVRAVLTRNGLPSDASHLYPVLLPQGVEACMSSANGAAGGSCTTNTSSPVTGQGFCGYHSSTTVGGRPAIYNLIPFPIYHSPTRFGLRLRERTGNPGTQRGRERRHDDQRAQPRNDRIHHRPLRQRLE